MSGATKNEFENLLAGLDGNSVSIGKCLMQSIAQSVASARRAASNWNSVRLILGRAFGRHLRAGRDPLSGSFTLIHRGECGPRPMVRFSVSPAICTPAHGL